MKKGIMLTAMMIAILVYLLPSCYKNKEDILTLPKVSFRSDVVPIVVSGGCGCHNNGKTSNAAPFSHVDTIFYDAILARAAVLDTMATLDRHPGGGVIVFTPNQKTIINNWYDEGAKDDGGGCVVTGPITHTNNINPIYLTTCKGATCHGGLAIALDYNKMVEDKVILTEMMNSGGATGHKGPVLSLSTCTANTFLEWISQGQPK